MAGKPESIVIKKKRGGHLGGHHGGAWKVAYADFVTAMMAFFLVMWIVAQSPVIKAAVAGYFKDPGIFDQMKSNGAIPGGEIKLDPEAPPELRASTSGRLEQVQALEAVAQVIKDLVARAPDLADLQDQIEFTLTREGLRIELLESSDETFFDSGSAEPRPETTRILRLMAGELGKLQNTVMVEGHTDATPYARSDGYSNWELSTDRANAARRVMERSGLASGQVQGVRGYADTHLRTPSRPHDSGNRRVSIVVRNLGAGSALLDDLLLIEQPTDGNGEGPGPGPIPE